MLHNFVYYIGLTAIFLYGLWCADVQWRDAQRVDEAFTRLRKARLRRGRYMAVLLAAVIILMFVASRYEVFALAPVLLAGLFRLYYLIERRRLLRIADRMERGSPEA